MTRDDQKKPIIKKPISNALILRTILDNSDDTIYFKDCDSKFILNSKAHAIQVGESGIDKMIGKSDFDYFPSAFAQVAFEEEQLIMKNGNAKIRNIEKWVLPDNTIIWLSASKYPLYDENLNIIGTWGTSRDITALKNAEIQLELLNQELERANERLEKLSAHDALSGLYNHGHFYETLALIELRLKSSSELEFHSSELGIQSGYSLILFDIDNFKSINDSYGHLVGDQVIKQIGQYLKQITRNIDMCFRYGGDEFALIIEGNDHEVAISLAEKIRVMLADMSIHYSDISFNITVSLGVVSSNEANSVNDLVALADERLYHSKESGRNKVT